MGIYSKAVLPWLLDLAMRNRRLAPLRERAVEPAAGLVLEIGVGSGVNLPLYGPAATAVVALDPSPELLLVAARRRLAAPVPATLVRASADRLPFAAASFDTVVMTWTLCSIPQPLPALIEMRRVLKRGGQLLFVEHGLSPEPRVAGWQRRLTPLWKRIGGGCHLDRNIDELIRAAGFEANGIEIETGYMPGPKPWTFMYQGRAGRAQRG